MPTKQEYHKRLEAGLCPKCGGDREDKRFKTCEICRKIDRVVQRVKLMRRTPEQREEYNKKRREALQAKHEQGICIDCGAPSPVHWRCDACNKRLREKYQQEADMLRDAMEEEQW